MQKGPWQHGQGRCTAGLWHPSLEEPLPEHRQRWAQLRAYPSCCVLHAFAVFQAEPQQDQVEFPDVSDSFTVGTCGLSLERVLPVELQVNTFPGVLNLSFISRKTINTCIWEEEEHRHKGLRASHVCLSCLGASRKNPSVVKREPRRASASSEREKRG